MTLAQRLLAGLLVVIGALVAAIVILAGTRLNDRLALDTEDELAREAELVGVMWSAQPANPDSLADAAGGALQRRVTLIDSTGVVLGDSEFDGPALRALENHATRPEVIEARAARVGRAIRASASAGDEEMYVAIRHARGFVRTSIGTSRFSEIVSGARQDVLVASLIALIGAIVLATLFSRRVTRPIVELRDVTRAIAAGDLDRRPSLTAAGEVGDLAASVSRMTDELRRRLQEMTDEDGRLIAIIESLDEAIVAVDARGDVVRMNDAARSLFQTLTALPFPATTLALGPPLRQALASAMKGTVTDAVETTVGERTVALTARPLPAGGAVLAVLDLTERRRLETMRRDFVANVSHELKTPLTVIGGFAETLRDPGLAEPDRARFLDLVAANTSRMQRIVDDLLDLSRYESGAWTPKPVEIDLDAVVTDLFALFRPSATAKGLDLSADIRADARTIRFDATALRQILSNLIENAIRYTPAGAVTVSARRAEDDVLIAVRDTGVGIPPEHLSRIFERFYRADPSRSRADGGTGLGLAIVRHLVEAHGGRVSAESTPGGGTIIYLRVRNSQNTQY
ncbi:MAG TPA: ATP-binding protein [Gemmatimonadaceae bacterium]|nr:ATP-binding protein [Gemmatimonadaceae bacterium]